MDIELVKVVLAALMAWVICASMTACGFTSGGGTVIGTTSFLKEVNRGQKHSEHITNQDRRELAKMLRRY